MYHHLHHFNEHYRDLTSHYASLTCLKTALSWRCRLCHIIRKGEKKAKNTQDIKVWICCRRRHTQDSGRRFGLCVHMSVDKLILIAVIRCRTSLEPVSPMSSKFFFFVIYEWENCCRVAQHRHGLIYCSQSFTIWLKWFTISFCYVPETRRRICRSSTLKNPLYDDEKKRKVRRYCPFRFVIRKTIRLKRK